jgi:hypothetical protein
LYLAQLLRHVGELSAAKLAIEKSECKCGTDIPFDALFVGELLMQWRAI